MGTSGTVNNAFLAGLLGGVGNQMMTHEERQYQQKLSELKLKREVLAALSSDQTASPQAQALALQGLLSSPDQPKAKGIRGKLGQREGQSQLDEIISKIKAMPAQTLPAKPPIQVPAIPSAPQQTQAATGKPMSEVPPIQVPGMPGSPPLTPPKLGMIGAPPQLPQELPGMEAVPGLKADPSTMMDPYLARIRLQHELDRADVQADIRTAMEAGMPYEDAVKMIIGRMSTSSRVTQSKDMVPGEAIGMEKGTWWRAELDSQGNVLRYLPAGGPAAREGAPSDYKTFYAASKAAGMTDSQIVKAWADRQVDIAARKPVPGQIVPTTNPDTGKPELDWVSPSQRKSNVPPMPKPLRGSDSGTVMPKLGQASQGRIDQAQIILGEGDHLSRLVDAHPEIFGPAAGRFNSLADAIGSANPAVSRAATALDSYANLMPGLHSMRGVRAAEEFKKDAGRLWNNPAALKAKIAELQYVAKDVRSSIISGKEVPDDVNLMTRPAGVPPDYIHVRHSDGRTGWSSPAAAKQNNWQVIP